MGELYTRVSSPGWVLVRWELFGVVTVPTNIGTIYDELIRQAGNEIALK